ncbi:MAG: hypothetical protein HS111_12785 [Kofleriaceae bacterium]|nr:hypothetical protein [Kofleriaceae bacterium]
MTAARTASIAARRRRPRRAASRLPLLIVAAALALVGPPPERAHGENIVVRKLRSTGRALGSLVGAPVGGLIEAASTPTIRNVEDTGRRLLHDFEGATARRLDQAGDLAGRLVDRTFDHGGTLVDRVDASLEARILQVTTSAGATISHAGVVAQQVVGTVDRAIAANLARARRATLEILERADRAVTERLAQLDELVRLRLGDVGQLVHTTLTQVDELARQRIAQLDEAAGRRLGNLDVIATKQQLGLEAMLLRLGTLLGVFAFVAFLMWSAWNNFVQHSNTVDRIREDGTTREERRTLGRKLALWGLQTAFALGCLGVVVLAATYLPRTAERRRAAQLGEHVAALTAAARAYDFTAVRYHQSQLELLRPGDPTYRGIARKAELLRDVFGRPARLHTAAGLRELEAELEAARTLIPDDPDLLVIEAYVIWQIGTTRRDELDAAALCARALTARPRSLVERHLPSTFMLRALAESYVRRFRHDPYPPTGADPAERAALDLVDAVRLPGTSRLAQLQHVLDYNELVATLDRAVGPAYLAMLDAHVAYARAAAAAPHDRAAVARALDARTAEAAAVVEAWGGVRRRAGHGADPGRRSGGAGGVRARRRRAVAGALPVGRGSPAPGEPPAVPVARPPVVALPPLFFDGGARAAGARAPGATAGKPAPRAKAAARAEDPRVRRRAAAAPLRIRWAERWQPLLGKHPGRARVRGGRALLRARAPRPRLRPRLRRLPPGRRRPARAGGARPPAPVPLPAAPPPWASTPATAAARVPVAARIVAEAEALGAPLEVRLRGALDELGRARRLRFL